MHNRIAWLIFLLPIFFVNNAFSQQDVEFHLNAHLFPGKKVLKVKRDFYDPYLWVLAQNNEVYRVNSLTLAIDDYTATFSSYDNLQFNDIAGRSKDTVFIATNSTNVIEYKKGTLKVIGAADGILGVVNSIGVDYTGSYMTDNTLGLSSRQIANTLIIGANSGMCHYDYQKDVVTGGSSHVPAKVFETTYRTEMFSDIEFGSYPDFVLDYPVINFTRLTIYGGLIYYGVNGGFGNNINTAYYTNGYQDDYSYNFVLYANQFWGTENGLFQNQWNYSFQSKYGYLQYLNGINVNKIASIFGLISFGYSFIKENLLVGTANGLYFSNNKYQEQGSINKNNAYSFFHYDEIGNVAVNDICVNATSFTIPVCEDGAWIGADDGLYLIKPDYVNFLTSQSLKAISFQNQADTLSSMKVCSGDSIRAIVNTYTGNNMQWYKDGAELPTQSKDTLTIKTAGDYYAILYDPCGNVHLESNHLKVQSISTPVFSFNYPDKIQQCDGTTYTLKTDNNSTYHYRWYTNGTLNGDTTSSFIVTQTGKYKVEVSACTNSWVPSKEVEADLITVPVPIITADKSSYCQGDNATLTVATPVSPSYTINWYRDNMLLNNNSNLNSITTNVPGSYTVAVAYNSINTDGTTCSQISAVRTLVFNPLPVVIIERIVKTTLCDGQTIELLAHYNNGTVKWSTGETTDQINVAATGNYKVTVTSSSGCVSDTSIDIAFLPNPVLNLKDTSICTYNKQPITITGPQGYVKYAWNGITGQQTFQISSPQTVSLTVTDVNGCQASQSINIIEHCPDVHIPNTFTPNNDGINDTWNIEGLDQTASVKAFNRYGAVVFESKGYGVPWNGEYNGHRLPAGTYYYIINVKNGTQKFSGSITIIY